MKHAAIAFAAILLPACAEPTCQEGAKFIAGDSISYKHCDPGARVSVTHDEHGVVIVCTCPSPVATEVQ